jgi:hypothetical protein
MESKMSNQEMKESSPGRRRDLPSLVELLSNDASESMYLVYSISAPPSVVIHDGRLAISRALPNGRARFAK